MYIDEIDKLSKKGEGASITRDVGGEGVQQGLLKLIEGSIVRLAINDKRKHPKGDMIEIDTGKILFICGGAFVGLDKIINRRLESVSIGFNSTLKDKASAADYNEVTTKDLITFGMIPEFVGRFGMIANVEELDIKELIKILKEPKNSLTKQYKHLFELDGIKLEFEEEALQQIATKAKEMQTNARGLKNILEKILLPYQFDAVNLVERGLTKIMITKEAVEGKSAILTFDKKKEKKHESNS